MNDDHVWFLLCVFAKKKEYLFLPKRRNTYFWVEVEKNLEEVLCKCKCKCKYKNVANVKFAFLFILFIMFSDHLSQFNQQNKIMTIAIVKRRPAKMSSKHEKLMLFGIYLSETVPNFNGEDIYEILKTDQHIDVQQTIYNKFDESVPRLKSQLKARSAQFKTMKKEMQLLEKDKDKKKKNSKSKTVNLSDDQCHGDYDDAYLVEPYDEECSRSGTRSGSESEADSILSRSKPKSNYTQQSSSNVTLNDKFRTPDQRKGTQEDNYSHFDRRTPERKPRYSSRERRTPERSSFYPMDPIDRRIPNHHRYHTQERHIRPQEGRFQEGRFQESRTFEGRHTRESPEGRSRESRTPERISQYHTQEGRTPERRLHQEGRTPERRLHQERRDIFPERRYTQERRGSNSPERRRIRTPERPVNRTPEKVVTIEDAPVSQYPIPEVSSPVHDESVDVVLEKRPNINHQTNVHCNSDYMTQNKWSDDMYSTQNNECE